MERFGDNEGIYKIKIPIAVADAINKLKGASEIVYAEPNYIYHHAATSNDPYFTNGSLWGMYGDLSSPQNQYGSQASEAWAKGHTGSASTVVGLIDEGSMFAHEDLSANFWTNPYDPVDGVDNDGNGFIDDVHGWDFYDNDNTTFDGTGDDHGTHTAGTIGAVGGNGKGVAGVNWKVTMINTKFLGPFGGSTDDAIECVDYLTDLKVRHGLKIVATNNSWGGGGFSQGLKDAIDRAGQANILFCAAAGNYTSNDDVSPFYPASYTSPAIISVAAINSAGGLAYFSNYGAKSVDIAAPGQAIYSTLPGANNSSIYGSYDGTSMATPHVTGAIALAASLRPNLTAAQLKTIILRTAKPTPSLSGKCVTGGRLDMSRF
jgi:subtilisin family serine protease